MQVHHPGHFQRSIAGRQVITHSLAILPRTSLVFSRLALALQLLRCRPIARPDRRTWVQPHAACLDQASCKEHGTAEMPGVKTEPRTRLSEAPCSSLLPVLTSSFLPHNDTRYLSCHELSRATTLRARACASGLQSCYSATPGVWTGSRTSLSGKRRTGSSECAPTHWGSPICYGTHDSHGQASPTKSTE